MTAALGESLRASGGAATATEALLEEVRQVQALVASLPDLDERTADEILGYDRRGLPR